MKRFSGKILPLSAVMSAAMTVGLLGFAGTAFADPPVSMAPPLDTQTVTNEDSVDVFNWDEIPENEKVPLTRAIFDQGGYQLYDTVGETIIVPFTNKNLYVMKFAVSPDDTLYFVNENGTPVLYIPQNGYLENATVPGAKWYPFSEKFHPVQPIYMGVAPSYTEYINTGWYSDTVLYGGYCGATSFISGGIFRPSLGLTFIIGNRPYYGWNSYNNYVYYHPAPYHIRYWNPRVYAYRPYRPSRPFQGYSNFPRNGGDRDNRDHHGGWNRPGGNNRPGNWDHRNDGWHSNGGGSGAIDHGFHGADPNHTSPGGNTGAGRPASGTDGRPRAADPGRVPDRRWHGGGEPSNRPENGNNRPSSGTPGTGTPRGGYVFGGSSSNGSSQGTTTGSLPNRDSSWNRPVDRPDNRPTDRPRGGFQGGGQFQGGTVTNNPGTVGNSNGSVWSGNNNRPAGNNNPSSYAQRQPFVGGGQSGGARFDGQSNSGASPTTATGGRPAFLGGNNNNNNNSNYRGATNNGASQTYNRQPFLGGGNNPVNTNGGQQFNRNGNSNPTVNRTFSPGRTSTRSSGGGRSPHR